MAYNHDVFTGVEPENYEFIYSGYNMTQVNPYQNELANPAEMPYTARGRSPMLAYFSIVIAGLIGIAILATQNSFARMFDEFEIKLPLVTTIACWSGLPISLFVVAGLLFWLGLQPNFQSKANRTSGMVIVSSLLVLSIYVWGVFTPLMNLIAGLSR